MAIMVTRPFLADEKEYQEVMHTVWVEHYLTNGGPLHNQLRSQLRDYLKVDDLHLTVNGHLALEALISSLNAPAGSEIITTPFTFASTTHAIVRQNLVPVFCDVCPDNLTMDPDKIEALITDKTVAILPVHVYGHPCQVEKIDAIARKHGLKVLYDAAHAFAVRYKGRALCDYGDGSILSFHATKLYHTIEGGAAITHDPDMSERVELAKNYGIVNEEEVVLAGGNAKMNEFQAAMGIVNLRHIDEIMNERRELTLLYRSLLDKIPGISYFVPENDQVFYNYAYFPVLVDPDVFGMTRDELYVNLLKAGIHGRKYFYPLTSDFDCYRDVYPHNVPVAQEASYRVMTLPIYNGLAKETVAMICDEIAKCGARQKAGSAC